MPVSFSRVTVVGEPSYRQTRIAPWTTASPSVTVEPTIEETFDAGIFAQNADALEFDECAFKCAADTDGTRTNPESTEALPVAARSASALRRSRGPTRRLRVRGIDVEATE